MSGAWPDTPICAPPRAPPRVAPRIAPRASARDRAAKPPRQGPASRRWQLFSVLTKAGRIFHFRSGFSAVPWQVFSVLTKWAPPIWSKPNFPASEGSKSGVRDAKSRVGLVKTEKSCQGRTSAWRDSARRRITGAHFRAPTQEAKGRSGAPPGPRPGRAKRAKRCAGGRRRRSRALAWPVRAHPNPEAPPPSRALAASGILRLRSPCGLAPLRMTRAARPAGSLRSG